MRGEGTAGRRKDTKNLPQTPKEGTKFNVGGGFLERRETQKGYGKRQISNNNAQPGNDLLSKKWGRDLY